MLHECLRSALASLCAHPLRSVLTMLGISIGVAAVIAVVALVQGLSQSIMQEFQGLGGNTFTVRSEMPGEEHLPGKRSPLKVSDLEQIRSRITGITHITPAITLPARGELSVQNGPHTSTGMILGVTERHQDVQQTYPMHGRFITESDDIQRRRVVVLGEQVRRSLKLPANPTGHYIRIGSEWFKVVGLMTPRGEVFGTNQDNYLFLPFQTALSIGGITDTPDLYFSFTIADIGSAESISARLAALLRQLHGIKAGQPDDFVVESAKSLQASINKAATMITLSLGGVVGISLIVGGVGIMNIMLVSVTERTREIGIAKALGAPRLYILLQFLIEAMLLAVIGGMIGTALGYALALAVAALIPDFPQPSMPWWAVAGATFFSSVVGVVFGILPARNAANLAPIEALRHE